MKKGFRTMLSMFLCLVLFVGNTSPVLAANEDNELGIIFEAVLDKPVITVSSEDQSVVMQIKTNKGITMNSMGMTIIQDSPLVLAGIAGGDDKVVINASQYNLENGRLGWTTSDMEDITDVSDLVTVTFNVPANTPAGTYNVGVTGIELSQGNDIVAWETSATASAALTITDDVSVTGYAASLTTLTNEVSVDDTITVNVGISHSTNTTFAAGEMVISYDNTKISFNQASSTLGTATVKDNAGVLKLEDYGTDKNFGNGVYVLAFDAIADGETTVTLTSAAFVNKENAVKSDLITATLSQATVNLTINKRTHTISLPEIFEGKESVIDGEDYTFSVADENNYDYDAVSATMNGIAVDVIDNGDGSYTIKSVTGALVITGTRTEKTYNVTLAGNAAEDITDAADKAIYNTD